MTLTFHGIDTWTGATTQPLRADVSFDDGIGYRVVRTFETVNKGRSDGALLEGAAFRAGRYELMLHVGDYYAALGTALPSPAFLTRVPIRFGVADARERFHVVVLFGPWSYAYYRGS